MLFAARFLGSRHRAPFLLQNHPYLHPWAWTGDRIPSAGVVGSGTFEGGTFGQEGSFHRMELLGHQWLEKEGTERKAELRDGETGQRAGAETTRHSSPCEYIFPLSQLELSFCHL